MFSKDFNWYSRYISKPVTSLEFPKIFETKSSDSEVLLVITMA